jgi:D-3-phosphoglycerate dehydrogenase
MKILVTCPPMLGMINHFKPIFDSYKVELIAPSIVQTLPEEELKRILPQVDGWIIGDDPANKEVLQAGKFGNLKAAVKWGIGIDNVDFNACKELGLQIANTPDMFGGEVADIAVGYLIALARHTYEIDRNVKKGLWIKPRGISLAGKSVAIVGYGDIGKSVAKRLIAADMKIIAYDPKFTNDKKTDNFEMIKWPNRISEADFIVLCCALTSSSRYILDEEILKKVKKGVRIINVARGPVINEKSLEAALELGIVHSAALDVFENEPLPINSKLRNFENCIFGSHNASNTEDAVIKTSHLAIEILIEFLGIKK